MSESGGQYPGGEYEGKQDATGMMLIRRMAGTTQPARTTASKMRRVRWRVRRDGKMSIRRMVGRTMPVTTTASILR